MTSLHFLRPYWLLAFIPWLILIKLNPWSVNKINAWNKIVDAHLLAYLLNHDSSYQRNYRYKLILLSLVGIIISLAGPSFKQSIIPSYHLNQPKVVVLNLSYAMLDKDLVPDRLTQAKFKLHDLFASANKEQFGLIVYTAEPFVVSPLTEDSKTIEALLPSLAPDIMPVEGDDLSEALIEGQRLIHQAGFKAGQMLVITPNAPDRAAIDTVKKLANQSINTSIMPLYQAADVKTDFQEFATAGQGLLLSLDNQDIDKWLAFNKRTDYKASQQKGLQWDDAGRWFLIPVIGLILLVFRKGYFA